ncbi:hypothetical protein CS022_20805 [Veronia nyctiphanis]|uniref:Uncharacterized protein n=1 Tax=Veronia nyctiphanis TaxID=1278244 RepID=A0A4V1LSF6_9GAMM|nr:hypothetical protein [Veronia nyctiphanis]RXJ71528.1 hypothetical protein CS022_20805 [Veronia nyctiphanis]
MGTAETVSLLAAGLFFLTGLLTGIWKYLQIMASEKGEAHPYVDICHRTSLMYSFAAILLAKFAEVSQLDDTIETMAALVVLVYFVYAILTYMLHGLLQDTDNQLRKPFLLGRYRLPKAVISFSMWSLVVAEVGGFLVLFYGVVIAVV